MAKTTFSFPSFNRQSKENQTRIVNQFLEENDIHKNSFEDVMRIAKRQNAEIGSRKNLILKGVSIKKLRALSPLSPKDKSDRRMILEVFGNEPAIAKKLNSGTPQQIRYQINKYKQIIPHYSFVKDLDPDKADSLLSRDLQLDAWKKQRANVEHEFDVRTGFGDHTQVGDPEVGRAKLAKRRPLANVGPQHEEGIFFDADERAYISSITKETGQQPTSKDIRSILESYRTNKNTEHKKFMSDLRDFAEKLGKAKGLEGEDLQAYKKSLSLEYGHLGPASVGGYMYNMNNLNNIGPELGSRNVGSGAGINVAQQENLHRIIAANEGFVWTPNERQEFNRAIMEPMKDRMYGVPLTEKTTRALNILDDIPETQATLLPDDNAPQIYDKYGRYSGRSNRPASVWDPVIAWERSLPNFDWESQVARNRSDYHPDTNIDRVRAMTDENKKTWREIGRAHV